MNGGPLFETAYPFILMFMILILIFSGGCASKEDRAACMKRTQDLLDKWEPDTSYENYQQLKAEQARDCAN